MGVFKQMSREEFKGFSVRLSNEIFRWNDDAFEFLYGFLISSHQ